MSSIDYDEGDLVQLKSGGPVMTVEKIIANYGCFGNGRVYVICTFFSDGRLQKAEFLQHTLKKICRK